MASRSTTGARGGSTEADFDIRSNLRQVLADLKGFDPALAREVRKMLRHAGDDAINAMKAVLDEPPPGVVTGKTYAKSKDARGRKRRQVSGVTTRGANRSRSTGARRKVAAGIKMRVTTGKSRTTVRIVSTTGSLHRMYNARTWRHPVFGNREEWVEQAGTRYFTRGAFGQAQHTYGRLLEAAQVAVAAVDGHNSPPT